MPSTLDKRDAIPGTIKTLSNGAQGAMFMIDGKKRFRIFKGPDELAMRPSAPSKSSTPTTHRVRRTDKHQPITSANYYDDKLQKKVKKQKQESIPSRTPAQIRAIAKARAVLKAKRDAAEKSK